MIRLVTLALMILSVFQLYAQAPQKMSYQAVIHNASNALVTNTSIGMKISILQGSATGAVVYAETQNVTSNINGLVSLEIGTGTVVSGSFATISWANGPFFIKTETDPNGGANYTITGTSQMLSVPYALYAEKCGTSINGSSGYSHYIGEQFGGGVIFHLWKDNLGVEHGLVVALTDQSSSQAWSNVASTAVGIGAQSYWDGLSNSNAIVSQAGHNNSAAKLCLDLVNGGFDDWYLPSVLELQLLSSNYYQIAKTFSITPGATNLVFNSGYWSSSESANNKGWYYIINGGRTNNLDKTINQYVRAIRAF